MKEDAVPSLFAWSPDDSAKRKSPRKRLFNQSPSINDSAPDNEIEGVNYRNEGDSLPTELEKLTALNQKLMNENGELHESMGKLISNQFGIEKFKESDADINFYTGFPKYETLWSCYIFLNPGENGENIVYVTASNSSSEFQLQPSLISDETPKQGRKRKLSTLNEFFMVLVRLRLGLFEQDLAHRFGVHKSTVNRICTSWVNFMYLKFGYINIWPTREMVDQAMPLSFKDKFPKTRVIIDCTEIKCQTPSSLVLHSETYSSYKSHTTFKGLVGIAPSGHVTFISQLYTGSISDREITVRSGLLKLPFDKGDVLMADKGFTNEDLLEPIGVKLNIPPFVGSQSQHTAAEVIATQEIASERIHVESAINKIKNFQILNQVIPISIAGSINQMWTVCAMLTNLQNPIIT